jgi:ethanolaminephosphotransferase
VMYSPTDVKSIDPRAFLITNGLIFSNITCRLMVSQMSGQVAEYVNKLLILLALVIMASLVVPQYELMLLYSLMFIVMIVHVHYGCSVVYELCTHFNIYTFSLKKLE